MTGPSILLITVRLHEGRYHGAGEAEPSPARLFQALIAGAARGGIQREDREAFEWLEQLAPPVIALPLTTSGQRVGTYVPNNDLDAVGGNPSEVGEVRVLKSIQPRLFDREVPFLFAWEIPSGRPGPVGRICEIAQRLYQFGRGVDLAWAQAEQLEPAEFEARLRVHGGRVLRPSGPGDEQGLRCPQPGSFESLERRFQASRNRLRVSTLDRKRQVLVQPPKPRFASIAYGGRSRSAVFRLAATGEGSDHFSWALTRSVALVVAARDGAVVRLKEALPDHHGEIERCLVGRRPDGSGAGPVSARVRIVPLPSIGHAEVDRQIRRMLVEVPPECPLSSEDVFWAFSGLELQGCVLSRTFADPMIRHYLPPAGVTTNRWSTVTPLALSRAVRRRIEPTRRVEEAKGGAERVQEEQQAVDAIRQALRHAEVNARIVEVRVQRESFAKHGERAESFAVPPRYLKEQLWHAEVVLSGRVQGPLLLGDGRFLGLGLFEPSRRTEKKGVRSFAIEEGLPEAVDPEQITRALRRAVMARVQGELGKYAEMPTYFSGHDKGGQPATHPHLAYTFDPERRRLLIIAPFVLERRTASWEELKYEAILTAGLDGLVDLRAGRAGRLRLRPDWIDLDVDPLFTRAQTWESVTPFQVTRHLKRVGAAEAFRRNLIDACRARALPIPDVGMSGLQGRSGEGLTGRAVLTFASAVAGPILLGRGCYLGGGVFVARPASSPAP